MMFDQMGMVLIGCPVQKGIDDLAGDDHVTAMTDPWCWYICYNIKVVY